MWELWWELWWKLKRLFDWRLNKRAVRFWYQRRTRGWSDDDTWSLDYTIAKFILPRLIRFKEIHGGYPHALTEEQWDKHLTKMIKAFDILVNRWDSDIGWDFVGNPMQENMTKEVEEGLDLFREWFYNLWW